jgi:hypothetical protein
VSAACACGKDCACAKKTTCACGKDCACAKSATHCPWLHFIHHHPRAALRVFPAPLLPEFVHGMLPPPWCRRTDSLCAGQPRIDRFRRRSACRRPWRFPRLPSICRCRAKFCRLKCRAIAR